MSNYFSHLLQQSGLTKSGLSAGLPAPLDAPRPMAPAPLDMHDKLVQAPGIAQAKTSASSDVTLSRSETPLRPPSSTTSSEEAPGRAIGAPLRSEAPDPPERFISQHKPPRQPKERLPVEAEELKTAARLVGETSQTPLCQEPRPAAVTEQRRLVSPPSTLPSKLESSLRERHVAEDDVARDALDGSSPNGYSPNKPMLMEQVRAWVAAMPDPGTPAQTAATSTTAAVTEDRVGQARDGTRVAAARFGERFQAAPSVPRPAHPGPAHQDLHLSVGAIHLTVEAPDPAATPPASPASSVPTSAPTSSRFSQSRLLRRYLRIR